jgi:hypothetical protein
MAEGRGPALSAGEDKSGNPPSGREMIVRVYIQMRPALEIGVRGKSRALAVVPLKGEGLPYERSSVAGGVAINPRCVVCDCRTEFRARLTAEL